jgi:hypothetical protein
MLRAWRWASTHGGRVEQVDQPISVIHSGALPSSWSAIASWIASTRPTCCDEPSALYAAGGPGA